MTDDVPEAYDGPDDIGPFDRSAEIAEANRRWREQQIARLTAPEGDSR